MSEPTPLELQEVVEIFLKSYNEVHSSFYYWDSEKSYQAENKQTPWIDAVVYDGVGKYLQIQHKSVIWDPEFDKARDKASIRIIESLKYSLTENGMTEYSIHLNFYQDKIISTDEEILDFCFSVTELIRRKSGDEYPSRKYYVLIPNTLKGRLMRIQAVLTHLFRNIRDAIFIAADQTHKIHQLVYKYRLSDDFYLNKIKAVSSELVIFRNPKQTAPVIGWGYSKPEPRPMPHYGDVVINQIKKQVASHYENLIVLLDCNRPLDEYDWETIVKQISAVTHNSEIWLVENFAHKKSAVKL